jgi:Predicted O-methyltransferase
MHFIPEPLDNYVVAHSQQEPELLKELTRETWQKVLNPRMLSGAFQGRILSLLTKIINPKHILEIGTYTGYATLCFAEGLQKNGTITTLDKNEELETLQNKYFLKSGFRPQIKQHFGKAFRYYTNFK